MKVYYNITLNVFFALGRSECFSLITFFSKGTNIDIFSLFVQNMQL
jgi:hypothetical protein